MTDTAKTRWRALGLMSGTSMDGVDLALVDTDGERVFALGATGFRPYDDDDRALLRDAIGVATGLTDRAARPPVLREAERRITDRHAEAVEMFLADHGLSAGDVDVVGFHGQTVLHRPDARLTVQIGDGASLAQRSGIPVVADMRAADVAAGGQGAPLVPVFHRALVDAASLPPPVLVINIGGVANVTLLASGQDPVACDTGPGNALLDDLMLARTGAAYDEGGRVAAQGRIDAASLDALMAHPFFAAPLPKSLDRNAFSAEPVARLSLEDAAATLTAFTAATIAKVVPLLPVRPATAVVCGGGTRNPTLMAALAARLPCPVVAAEACGWAAEAIEAQAFAFLAVRSLRGLPLTFPGTTGVSVPLTGGVLHRPEGRPGY